MPPAPKKPTWTTKPTEVVIQQRPDGSLFTSMPIYRDGVKQFTREETVDGAKVTLFYRAAPGCTLTGFYAGSDF